MLSILAWLFPSHQRTPVPTDSYWRPFFLWCPMADILALPPNLMLGWTTMFDEETPIDQAIYFLNQIISFARHFGLTSTGSNPVREGDLNLKPGPLTFWHPKQWVLIQRKNAIWVTSNKCYIQRNSWGFPWTIWSNIVVHVSFSLALPFNFIWIIVGNPSSRSKLNHQSSNFGEEAPGTTIFET